MKLIKKVAVLSASALVSAASGTWSIVIIDTRTGEVALGSATCLTGFDLQANTPVMLVGVGGATAQSSVDTNGWNRTYIRDRFLDGWSPAQILTGLSTFDNGHQSRQYGIADVLGRAVTFSGTGAGNWKGGQTGTVGDLVYAVQGNVLAGDPVVSLAVDAIVNTPGDVAEKLMAAMEAARSMGGDGRCSCSQSAPDSCGSPPPDFTKAAHIAYMLIARRGDVDGSNGNYKTAPSAQGVVAGDFDGDGVGDVVAAGGTSGSLSFFKGVGAPGTLPRLAAPAVTQFGGTLRDVASLDFDGDGKLDLVVVEGDGSKFYALRGRGDGTFEASAPITISSNPRAIALFDVDGDGDQDVAVASQAGAAVSILKNDGGVFGLLSITQVGSAPNMIASGDLDGDGREDLIVGDATAKSLVLLRNASNAGVLENLGSIALPAAALGLGAGDTDGDGVAEIFAGVNNSDLFVRMFRKGSDGYEESSLPLVGTSGAIQVRDVNGDGIVDVAAMGRSKTLMHVIAGNGDGTFRVATAFPVGWSMTRFTLADLDGDGAADIVGTGAGGVMVMRARGPGVFNPQSGLGGGDYYMTFNVANQKVVDPDPVYQLRDLFNAWRSELVGVADAVRSSAEADQTIIRAEQRGDATITIMLRDFAGTGVSIDPSMVSLAHAPGSARVTTLGEVRKGDNGILVATVSAGARCGVDRIEVVVNHDPRPIVLMPALTMTVTSPADMNLDGLVDSTDYDVFAEGFVAGSADADFNGDGFVNGDDYDAFSEHYDAGC